MERSLDDRALMETTDSQSVAKPSNANRSIAWLQAVAFVLGAVLLVYVIRKVGVQPIFCGATLMLFAYPVPAVVREVLVLISSVAFLGLLAAAMASRRRVTVLTNIIDSLGRRGFKPRFLRTRRHHIYRVELTVYGFY